MSNRGESKARALPGERWLRAGLAGRSRMPPLAWQLATLPSPGYLIDAASSWVATDARLPAARHAARGTY